MLEIRPTHRAYIAGIFDGEGCITFHKRPPSGKPYISLQQRDPQAMYWIHETMGCGRLLVQNRKDPGHEGTVYRLVFQSYHDMSKFIRTVEPYSILKKSKLRQARRWIKDRGRWE